MAKQYVGNKPEPRRLFSLNPQFNVLNNHYFKTKSFIFLFALFPFKPKPLFLLVFYAKKIELKVEKNILFKCLLYRILKPLSNPN